MDKFFTGYSQNKRLEMLAKETRRQLLGLSVEQLVKLVCLNVSLDTFEKLNNITYAIEDLKDEY